MTIRSPFYPIGGGKKYPYKKGEVLFNGKNGDAITLNLYPGLYYIRGQGAGGGGGNNNYWHNGVGGGSGAGFEGYIRFKKNCTLLVGAGTAGANSAAGTNTYINDILILSGGQGGLPAAGGQGGIFQFIAAPSIAEIVSFSIKSDGNNGIGAPSNADGISGGNSVLTNSGGGKNSNNATAPGAGGGGQWQWGGAGGTGMYGELFIRFERLKI